MSTVYSQCSQQIKPLIGLRSDKDVYSDCCAGLLANISLDTNTNILHQRPQVSLIISSSRVTLPNNVLERSQKDDLCGGVLDLKSYFLMNKVCEDCFSLYRDTDIYSACRYC